MDRRPPSRGQRTSIGSPRSISRPAIKSDPMANRGHSASARGYSSTTNCAGFRLRTATRKAGRPSPASAEKLPRLISVGRLDFNTEGFRLLTNDGALARVLELLATGWLRRYRVRAHGPVYRSPALTHCATVAPVAQCVKLGLGEPNRAPARGSAAASRLPAIPERARARLVGEQENPSVLKSSRPTLMRRGRFFGKRWKMVGRPCGSLCEVKSPRGLW